jgi:DNA-binding HxlR family transcriptional regulator
MTTLPDHAAPLDEPGENPAAAPALKPEQCAVARCAELVCAKWTLLVVRDLLDGPRSYSELEASLAGIAPRTLCARLKQLAAAGMVTRTRIKALPPRTTYELTVDGHALRPIIEAMRTVGEHLPMLEQRAAATGDGEASCCDEPA